jgi:hypothetical protein
VEFSKRLPKKAKNLSKILFIPKINHPNIVKLEKMKMEHNSKKLKIFRSLIPYPLIDLYINLFILFILYIYI